MRGRPYFLKNPEWYVEKVDKEGLLKYELTDKAPKKAVESYKEYQETRLGKVVFDKNGRPVGIADV